MADYRPVEDDDAFWRLVEYAFSPENGPYDPEEATRHTVGEPRGWGDDLLAVCRHYDFRMTLRGSVIDAGGVGVLASDPAHRRAGNVRALLAASLAEYRERGRRLATLWPFDVGFYRALGWATVSKLASWEVAPGDLAGLAADGASADRDAGFERLGPDDWERLVPVRRADRADRDLTVRRSETWWRQFVFDRWDGEPFVYGWVVDGEVRAYLVYEVSLAGDDRVLTVREQAARDTEARRQLFRFCRDHDSQVDLVRFYTASDAVAGEGFDPHFLLDDPGAADATVSAGGMARLVDVAADLPAVAGPAADPTTAFDLVVEDPLADWNDGRFRVTLGDELAVERVGHVPNDDSSDDGRNGDRSDGQQSETAPAVEPAGDPGGADRPTVRVGVGPLTQVVVGARSAARLAAVGRVAGDEAAITALDDCFPPGRPMLGENF